MGRNDEFLTLGELEATEALEYLEGEIGVEMPNSAKQLFMRTFMLGFIARHELDDDDLLPLRVSTIRANRCTRRQDELQKEIEEGPYPF